MADVIDFADLQNNKAIELTEKILAKLGEMYLQKEIGPNDNPFGLAGFTPGPKEAIRILILDWLTEEKEDG